MATERRYVVRDEDDAWRLLADVLKGEARALSRTPLEFEGWPHFSLRLVDAPPSSITPSMMQGLIEFQRSIYRTHALYRYDTADIRVLPDEDKSLFEFRVQVSGRSSIYDIDLQDILTRLAIEVAHKMDPVDIIILVLGGALIFTAGTSWKAWLNDRADTRREEGRSSDTQAALAVIKDMSSEETERVRLLSEAIKQQQKLEVVKVEADNAKKEILKGVGGTGDAEIQGISVPAPTAEELVKGVRSQSIETRIDGLFQILTVDTTSPDGFRVRLRNDESGEVFTAGLQDALLSESQKQAIQDAEWNKRLLKAKINARRIGRELTDAVVIDAEPVEAPRIGRSS